TDESEKKIDEVEKAHGLHGREPHQRRRSKDNHGDALLEDAVGEDGECKAREECVASLVRLLPKKPEKQERSEGTEPFVPCPAVEKVVAACFKGAMPGRGWRLEDPAERNRCSQRTAKGTEPEINRFEQVDREEEAKRDAERRHDGVENKR